MNQVESLPQELLVPGLIAGGGINRSKNRLALGLNELYRAQNITSVDRYGLGNKNIGVEKFNTTNVSTEPVRAIFKIGDKICTVKNDAIHTIPTTGGAETAISTPTFDSSGKVRWAYNRGGTPKELRVYLCDGTNTPIHFDGTTAAAVTAFNSAILTDIPSTAKPDKVITWKDRLVWGFPASSNGYENYVLFSEEDQGDDYTGGASNIDAFYNVVAPGDGDNVTGFGTLKRNNQDEQAEQLIVFKRDKAYLASTITLGAATNAVVFNKLANDIGSINADVIINFNNQLYSMSNQGIGSFQSATDSGGVDAVTYRDGARINPLIQKASENTSFDQSFAIHCPDRQLIMFFMPENASVEALHNGYSYGEVPMNQAICLEYGVRDDAGNINNVWSTREGIGWGWSCAFVDGKDIYLGSYFGDVYKLFIGNEYERNPATPSERRPIASRITTGDMIIGGYQQYKNLPDFRAHWYFDSSVLANITLYWDEKNEGDTYLNKTTAGETAAAIYGTGLYGTDVYGFDKNGFMKLTAANGGRSVRIQIDWNSEKTLNGNTVSNHGSLHGMSGNIGYGGNNQLIIG